MVFLFLALALALALALPLDVPLPFALCPLRFALFFSGSFSFFLVVFLVNQYGSKAAVETMLD